MPRSDTHDDLESHLLWLRLAATPGLGRRGARALLKRFGPPDAIFAQPRDALGQVVGESLAAAVKRVPDGFADEAERFTAWWRSSESRTLLTLDNPHYPQQLLASADPPIALHAEGSLAWLAKPSIAIVGSRNPTGQGREHAHAFASALIEHGFTIVSGMALGIDGAAHAAALATMRGTNQQGSHAASTVAVIGTGIDRPYPSSHASMAQDIARHGLVLSELPLGSPPRAENFPQRNRIIAGLSLGTLVVEAALRSGSLITAKCALDDGRAVFAIPGSIHSPQSHGCHWLIRAGATLVEQVQDVLDELPAQSARRPHHASSLVDASDAQAAPSLHALAPHLALLQAMGHEPCTLDDVVRNVGMTAADAQSQLLMLEIEGMVQRLDGGRFQRLSYSGSRCLKSSSSSTKTTVGPTPAPTQRA